MPQSKDQSSSNPSSNASSNITPVTFIHERRAQREGERVTVTSHPTTWILCVSQLGARLFRYNSPEEGVRYFKDIPHTRTEGGAVPEQSALEEIASQMDEICHATPDCKLILCALSPGLEHLERSLSGDTQRGIAGCVEQDLFNVNESDMASYVADILSEDDQSSDEGGPSRVA